MFWPIWSAVMFVVGMRYQYTLTAWQARKELQASCYHSFRIESDKIGPQTYKTKVCDKCGFKEFHNEGV